jgi:DUF4097 and DUF4098 domain-containing protein YvlB
LRAEVTSNLVAAAIDKIAAGATADAAVDEAIAEFGDIAELINELVDEDGADDATGATDAVPVMATKEADAGQAKDASERSDSHSVFQADASMTAEGTTPQTDVTEGDSAAHDGDLVAHGGSGELTQKKQADIFLTHEMPGISEIQVDYTHDDIQLVPIDGSQLQVREYFKNFKPEYAGKITSDGGIIHVVHGFRPHVALQMNIGGIKIGFWSRIVVGIPSDFKGKLLVKNSDGVVRALNLRNLAGMNISVHDGNVDLNYLALDQLAVTTDDGDLSLQSSQLGEVLLASHDGNLLIGKSAIDTLAARSDDGDIEASKLNVRGNVQLVTRDGNAKVNAVRGENLQISTDDGDVHVQELVADQISVKSNDGNIIANDLRGNAELHTDDGDVRASFAVVTGDIDVTSGEGDVKISLPRTTDYNFDLHTGDGDIRQDEAAVEFTKHGKHRRRGQKGTTPEFTVSVDTDDGDITVK